MLLSCLVTSEVGKRKARLGWEQAAGIRCGRCSSLCGDWCGSNPCSQRRAAAGERRCQVQWVAYCVQPCSLQG